MEPALTGKSISSGTISSGRKKLQRSIKIALATLFILLLLSSAAIGAVSFYFSSAILQVIHYTPTYTLAVTDVGTKTLSLQRTSNTLTPGVFEIEWPDGQAIVGPILSANASSVTRQLLETTAPLSPGTLTYWTRNVYEGALKDRLGLTINNVQIPDSPGAMPAWYVPGKLTTWAILVHGLGTSRTETLRAFQPLAHLGLPLLAISYRNDMALPQVPTATNTGATPSGRTWKWLPNMRWLMALSTCSSTAGQWVELLSKPFNIVHPTPVTSRH